MSIRRNYAINLGNRLIVTHSPLLMSSIEPIFDHKKDKCNGIKFACF